MKKTIEIINNKELQNYKEKSCLMVFPKKAT